MGAPSVRFPGETWEELERRLAQMRPDDLPASAHVADTSLTSLEPEVRQAFERMLAAAREAGHRVRVVETLRSPERQAYLMVLGGGLTFTATSKHASGRAVDIVVGDRNLKHKRTRAIAFRRWLSSYDGGRFHLIGAPHKSWDWPHVELAGPMGYGSIESLLLAARRMQGGQAVGRSVGRPVSATAAQGIVEPGVE